jgi:hypothetical protein
MTSDLPLGTPDHDSLLDRLYSKTFSEETTALERRLAAGSLLLEDVEGSLKTLYELDGQDWLGRGDVSTTSIQAQIDAYEAFAQRLKLYGQGSN